MRQEVKHLEPGRPARPGQLILQRRANILGRLLSSRRPEGRLLDVGCGNGAQTRLLKPLARRLFGLDIVNINEAEGAIPGGEPLFVQSGAMALPFRDGSFDIVTAFEVLEHLTDDRAAVAEVGRVLRPGGYFFFSVPNRWWLLETHGAVVLGLSALPWNRIPFVGWLPRAWHRRIARAGNYTLKEASELATSGGLNPVAGGYITAPLDVLPDSALRDLLRATLFASDTTANPLLAVNLFILAQKAG